MANGDYIEYSIAHDRKYTLDHVWVQALDDKAESVKIGVSEFVPAEYGDIVRVVLTRPEDDSEFNPDLSQPDHQSAVVLYLQRLISRTLIRSEKTS